MNNITAIFETEKRNNALLFLRCFASESFAYIYAFGFAIYIINLGGDWKFLLIGIALVLLNLYKSYTYSKNYLLKIDLFDSEYIMLTILKSNGAIEIKNLSLNNKVKVEIASSLLSLSKTIATFKLNFIQNDKLVYCQYCSGVWDNNCMLEIRQKLKDSGIKLTIQFYEIIIKLLGFIND